MLIDSYDAQGIKFGIIMAEELEMNKAVFDGSNIDKIDKVSKEIITLPTTKIIDFSAFDGLTVEEVQHIMGYAYDTPIIFVIYSNFETSKSFSTDIYNVFILSNLKYRQDNLIDEEIEDTIKKYYQSYDKAKRRNVNCFLQRYRYGTKAKTDEAIKQYIKK